MVFGFGEHEDAHQQVYGKHHKSKLSHELIAGAVAFEAFKKFQEHQRKQGHQTSHTHAKEALAAIVGAEIDKLAETRGMDEWDRHEASKRAKENAEKMYDHHYGKG